MDGVTHFIKLPMSLPSSFPNFCSQVGPAGSSSLTSFPHHILACIVISAISECCLPHRTISFRSIVHTPSGSLLSVIKALSTLPREAQHGAGLASHGPPSLPVFTLSLLFCTTSALATMTCSHSSLSRSYTCCSFCPEGVLLLPWSCHVYVFKSWRLDRSGSMFWDPPTLKLRGA